MKKLFGIGLLLGLALYLVSLLLDLAVYFFVPKQDKEGSYTNSTVTAIAEKFEEKMWLTVLSADFSQVITEVFKRKMLSDVKIDYACYGNVLMGLDLKYYHVSTYSDSVFVYLPSPRIVSATIDHEKSRILSPSFYFGLDEFEMADSCYRKAQMELETYANSPALREKAKTAGKKAVFNLLADLIKSEHLFIIYN